MRLFFFGGPITNLFKPLLAIGKIYSDMILSFWFVQSYRVSLNIFMISKRNDYVIGPRPWSCNSFSEKMLLRLPTYYFIGIFSIDLIFLLQSLLRYAYILFHFQKKSDFERISI